MLTSKEKFEIQHNHKSVIELDDLGRVELIRHKSNVNVDGGLYAQAVRVYDLDADRPKFDEDGFEMDRNEKSMKIRNPFEKEVVKVYL